MKRALVAITSAFCLLAFAAPAEANTYCAVTSSSPTIPGVTCTSTSTEGVNAVGAALTAAQGNPGADSVVIGAGTFKPASGGSFSYSDTGNNAVTITGQGSTTILAGNALPVNTPLLSVTSNAAADAMTLENLSVVLPSGSYGNTGISSSGPNATTIRNVAVTSADGTPQGSRGLSVDDGDVVTGSSVVLPVNSFVAPYFNFGVISAGSTVGNAPVIQDSTVTATVGVVGSFFIAGPVFGKVVRCRIDAIFGAGMLGAGGMDVQDTLIKLEPATSPPSLTNPTGIGAVMTTPAASASVTARNVTVVGGTGTTDTGISVLAGQGSVSVDASSSILKTVETSVSRTSAGGGTSSVSLAYSDFDPATIVNSNISGTGSVTQDGSNVNVDPGFTNAAGGDYTLSDTSPLIDTGELGALAPGESATDLAGNPRITDGNGDGITRRDMGAFEHAAKAITLPPPPPPPGSSDTTPPDTKAGKFTKKTTKRKLVLRFSSTEAGSTFTCKLDKGKVKACKSPYAAKGLKLGKHVLVVTATDAAGNADPTPAKLRFTVKKKPKHHHH